MLQEFVASCEHIFSFMATWKCDSFNSRSQFKRHAKRPNSWPGSKVNYKHERHIAWAHFVHFGPLKIHLLPSLQTHVQGYLASCELIFCFLEASKCDFFRLVKPMLQGYVGSCEHIFTFMAPWKCDTFNSNSKFKGLAKNLIRCQVQKSKVKHVTTSRELTSCILGPQNTFTAESVKLTFKGTSFVRNHFLHFGGVKMRFLPCHETHATRVLSFVWSHLLLYGDLKMWVLIHGHAKRPNSGPGSKVNVKLELNIARATLCILAPWKYIYCRVFKLTF